MLKRFKLPKCTTSKPPRNITKLESPPDYRSTGIGTTPTNGAAWPRSAAPGGGAHSWPRTRRDLFPARAPRARSMACPNTSLTEQTEHSIELGAMPLRNRELPYATGGLKTAHICEVSGPASIDSALRGDEEHHAVLLKPVIAAQLSVGGHAKKPRESGGA